MPGGGRASNQRHGRGSEQGGSAAKGRQSKGHQQGQEEAQPNVERYQVCWLRYGANRCQTR